MDFFSILFGWLLGICGTLILEYYRIIRKRNSIIKSLYVELENIHFIISNIIILIGLKLIKLDKELITRIETSITSYKEGENKIILSNRIQKFKNKSDKELKEFCISQYKGNISNEYKKYSLPLLSTYLNTLYILPDTTQQLLSELYSKLETVNQTIESHWYFFTKTFDQSLSEQDRIAVENNLFSKDEILFEQYKSLHNKITDVLDQLG